MKYGTLREATYAWVNGFNAIPMSVVEKLAEYNPDSIYEITPPSKYDRVFVFSGEHNDYGEIVSSSYNDGESKYVVALDDGERVTVDRYDMDIINDECLPMWGTMWAFADQVDRDWLESFENLHKMADCGFRIYEQEDYGYIFGIDGAGYDFFEAHWEPLYKAVGLRWHEGADENS